MFIVKCYYDNTLRTYKCATYESAENTVRNLIAESNCNRKPAIIANLGTGEVWQTRGANGEYINFPTGIDIYA